MRIFVKLCKVIKTNMEDENDTLEAINTFLMETPIPTGTAFTYEGKTYTHAYDTSDGVDYAIIYVEQRIMEAPQPLDLTNPLV